MRPWQIEEKASEPEHFFVASNHRSAREGTDTEISIVTSKVCHRAEIGANMYVSCLLRKSSTPRLAI